MSFFTKEVAETLGKIAVRYRGTYTETKKGVEIFFISPDGSSIFRRIPNICLPRTEFGRTEYLVCRINQIATKLDEHVSLVISRKAAPRAL